MTRKEIIIAKLNDAGHAVIRLADILILEKKRLTFSPYKGVKDFYGIVLAVFAVFGFAQYDFGISITRSWIITNQKDIISIGCAFLAWLLALWLIRFMLSNCSKEDSNAKGTKRLFWIVGFVNSFSIFLQLQTTTMPMIQEFREAFGTMLTAWAFGYMLSKLFMRLYACLCMELMETLERKTKQRESTGDV